MDKLNRLIRKGNLILDYNLLKVAVRCEVRRKGHSYELSTKGLQEHVRRQVKKNMSHGYKMSNFYVNVERKGAYRHCQLLCIGTEYSGMEYETIRMNVSKKLFPEEERNRIKNKRMTAIEWLLFMRNIKNRITKAMLNNELDKPLSRTSYLCVLKDHDNKMNQVQGEVSRLLGVLNDAEADLKGLKATLTPYKQVEPYQAILSEVVAAGDNLKISLESVERCDKELDNSLSGKAFKDAELEEDDDEDIS